MPDLGRISPRTRALRGSMLSSAFRRTARAACQKTAFLGVPAWCVALGLTAATATLARVPLSPAFYVALVAGTALVYLGERLLPAPEDAFAHPARLDWLRRHRGVLRGGAAAGALAGLLAALHLRPATVGAGVAMAFAGGAYAWPLVGGRRLKTIAPLKGLLIAVVWAAATVLLPFVEAGRPLGAAAVVLFAARGLTVAANVLAHDWLDRQGDARAGVATLSQGWPWPRVRGVGRALLAGAALLLLALYPAFGPLVLVDALGLGLMGAALARPGADALCYGALLDALVAWPLVTALLGAL